MRTFWGRTYIVHSVCENINNFKLFSTKKIVSLVMIDRLTQVECIIEDYNEMIHSVFKCVIYLCKTRERSVEGNIYQQQLCKLVCKLSFCQQTLLSNVNKGSVPDQWAFPQTRPSAFAVSYKTNTNLLQVWIRYGLFCCVTTIAIVPPFYKTTVRLLWKLQQLVILK